MDQLADLDSSRLQVVNNLGQVLRSDRTTDDFLGDFSKLQVGSTIIL